ncbi:metal ABC transporter substrate-binding protein [Microbacterium sp. NC79]|uniref:metal ABC transporter substrate-binding protein n=1 Tax=Microbacterium sp. NC79 TaxID=2851009 RepID=UPI001C2C5832|nr:metal ABC transporter substrate-binding protein [Microbacterium sp. NC79]MBV0895658.1 metal ABC transporter substrate-binding protein [Microbacterium sp. NC79]
MPKNVQGRMCRWGALIALGALAGAVTACAAPGDETGDRPVVIATFSVLADIASEIGGEHIDVRSITKVGAEIHGYEPTPGDIRQGADADLIIENGWGLEAWFDQFVTDLDAPVVTLTDGLTPIDITSDAYAGKPNPHAWMSPSNVQHFAAVLADEFAQLDPEHAADFERNAAAYSAELEQVHTELIDALATIPAAQRTLVTCEGAFSYLTRDAGLAEIYIWPVNAEQQVTPQRLAAVIEAVETHDIPAVFCESTVSERPMLQVVSATDARFGGTLYVDSLSLDDGPVPTYLDLIRHDVAVIVDALAGGLR